MDNADFAAMATLARTEAVVTTARAKKCRRCPTVGGLDKRQLCPACNAVRLATMKADPIDLAERPVRPQVTTIASLLSGPSGFAQVQGADLNHCNAAMSARASMQGVFKKLEQLERFIVAAPQSDSGWRNYETMYDKIESYVRSIKFHESNVRDSFPDLVTEKILIPARLERAPKVQMLDVS